MPWKKVALTAGAIAIVAGSLTVAKRVISPGELVTEVIDGDTFVIINRQNIRLHGVDAPELQYCFGKEAKDALSKKILGKKPNPQEILLFGHQQFSAYFGASSRSCVFMSLKIQLTTYYNTTSVSCILSRIVSQAYFIK